uniref:AcnX domain-containing protein n=1 Tax=Mesocestoides corti TaxID=53468 RepID=A0A5K3FWA2_MESCO
KACSVVPVFYLLGLGYSTVASDQGADILDDLAAANPVSLCVPMACEKDKQPIREGHDRGAVYNERRAQRGGLGWKAPDV